MKKLRPSFEDNIFSLLNRNRKLMENYIILCLEEVKAKSWSSTKEKNKEKSKSKDD